ncbi:fumarylacetoacetate hydrolase family protein [Melioribacter sp. Ez-97]|uniref:fumarylacetoacetate hydrolase family protein n=1 Tax=Melioribacter sp. Ez-97 TaxID=3423434 RepID=UPI003EDA9903
MKYLKIKNSNGEIPIGKIVCVGRNYAAHALELGNEVPEFPVIFLKTASNVIYSGDKVIHPDYSNNLHHEVELVLLIGNAVKNADDSSAEDAIAGYAVGLDMTLRDLQKEFMEKGDPWTLSKCFDTSAVLSEFVLKKDYKLKGDETIKLSVNGELRQNSSIKNMMFDPVKIVKYISSKMTLEKGDLIFTGTPEGVGRVVPGDKIHAELENIGIIDTEIIK